MRTLLVSVDSKYIHTNLAIRLLKANTTYPVELLECTIKDSIDDMIRRILAFQADCIGFSVYLWNRIMTFEMIRRLKEQSQAVIVVGGPEVSYDSSILETQHSIDYIIRGEGEVAFHQLLESLHGLRPLDRVSNLSYREGSRIVLNQIHPIPDLQVLKSGYFIQPIDNHKIQYIESSRGCPYRCSYCLASLEKPVRYFPEESLYQDIETLIQSGAKVFKFLDRTFNSQISRTKRLFDFIIKHHLPGQSFQFEITGDIFPQTLVDYLHLHAPKHLFRFEIGIQSTHEETNRLVDRIQNNDRLFALIQSIQSHSIIDLHLDLIAGLPGETLERFQLTFNQVFALRAKELQLGFLKLLHGTKLRNEAHKYDYRFQPTPPYEIIENDVLKPDEIQEIHQVEMMLELYWNKQYFKKTFEALLPISHPYQFFYQLAMEYQKENPADFPQMAALFERFLQSTSEYQGIASLVKLDYLLYHPIKPKIWWSQAEDIKQRKAILRLIQASYPLLPIETLYKHSILIPEQEKYQIVVYQNNLARVYEWSD